MDPKSFERGMMTMKEYKQHLLDKCYEFVIALSEKGVEVARLRTNDGYRQYIAFGYEPKKLRSGVAQSIVYAQQTGVITSAWMTSGGVSGVKVADVSPLLMAEFGAGVAHDKNPKAHRHGMGAGTFPDQTHAFDKGGWWYQDLDGEWHHSDGIEPTMPMYRTALYLQWIVVSTAKRIFNS